MTNGTKSPSKNLKQKFGPNPVGSPCKDCSERKIKLVEAVEVVNRKGKNLIGVEGAALNVHSDIKEWIKRTDRDHTGGYKQYINLNKDLDGKDKRHPEYGRYIELRARVEWEDGSKDDLRNKKVRWRFELDKGDKRPETMRGAEKEGFLNAGGKSVHVSLTDKQGWTPVVKFYLSQYGGDIFKILVQADEDGTGKYSGVDTSVGYYAVWRKFWYQRTFPDTMAVRRPDDAVKEYDRVFAEMSMADDVTYTQANAPAKTFYPEWMVVDGGGNDDVVVLGNSQSWFSKKFRRERDKPVKAHLVICRAFWVPQGQKTYTRTITTNPADIRVPLDRHNYGFLKPALEGNLVINGRWISGGQQGSLSDMNVDVVRGRLNFKQIRVRLPGTAPNPTPANPVRVKLRLNYASSWEGEGKAHQIVVQYDPADLATYNHTVVHEIGHGFRQVPGPGKQPVSLNNHPKWYTGRGGVGPHCFTDATKNPPAGTRFEYEDGSCDMFHGGTNNPKHKFCETCEPYIRLEKMLELTGV